MDSDTEPVNEDAVDELRKSLSNKLSPEELEKFIQDFRTTFSSFKDNGKEHVVGAPLIDIQYVTIHSNSDDSTVDDELEIYGSIQVTDGTGDTYYIYDQQEDDPRTVPFDDGYGEIYLLDVEPIMPPYPVTKMDICLMDKTKGVELAKGTLIWDYTEKKFLLEEKGEKVLECQNYVVTVGYTTFEAAVAALVDLKLCKKNDTGDDIGSGCHDIDVWGEITASWECNYSFAKPYSTPLFSLGKEDPAKVKLGTSMPMYKSIVAVPVYSKLKIQVSLVGLADDYTLHPAQAVGFGTGQIEGSNGYLVDVVIQWRPGNPLKQMDWKSCSESIVDDDSPSVFWIFKETTKRNVIPTTFTEVFSIVVLPDEVIIQDAAVDLYGEIAVRSVLGDFYLFKRDESCSESVPCGQGKMLMIEGPYTHCFGGGSPVVRVKLKDAKGRVFCKGYLGWNEVMLRFDPYKFSWYDRRLCSVIQGKYGLVKVHYSIFRKAVRATVMVLFSFDDSSREFVTCVNGNIFGSYGNYYTPYDKEYYRSMLFLKSQESPVELFHGRKIPLPLLKPVISVPADSCLIIDIDLFASTTVGKPSGEALKGVAKFEVGIESCWRLKKKSFLIDVLVDWG